MQINRKSFVLLAFLTFIVMSPIGLAMVVFKQEKSIAELFFSSNFSWLMQLLIGAVYGIGGALIATSLIKIPFFQSVKSHIGGIFSDSKLSLIDIALISIFVGIGEELLFRAGIQPLLGVWLTSVIFVLVHGIYLDPRKPPFFIIGLFLILLSAGMGYLFEYVSITAAIMAHAIYDAISLWVITKDNTTSNEVSD